MNEKQGYFSLIQYSEYPERAEFVNIGIVMFSNASPRVLIKFSRSSARIRRVFGVHIGKHFELIKKSMENRIEVEFSKQWNKSQLDRFINLRSGNIRLSDPKSILVVNPVEVMNELFESLVDAAHERAPVQRVQTKLKNAFVINGVENLLDTKPSPVPLPQGVTIKAHYGYQNGSYNLINAISLRDDPEKALETASKQAIEGRWLSQIENDSSFKKLVVVGDVENQERNFVVAVKEMMENHDVWFHTLSDMEPLASDIRKNVVKSDLSESIYE